MPPYCKIAVIQLYVKPLKPADNFARAVQFIREAAAQGCHLAVLPEFHLTNWIPTDPSFAALCDDWENYVHRYQALAKECNICIVPGSIVRPVSASPQEASASSTEPIDKPTPALENVAFFISNTGEILGSYRAYLRSSGNSPHQVISTPLGPVGLLVCWDLAFPEAWRELVSQGAKIIIVPTLWTRSGASEAGHRQNPSAPSLFLDSILTARTFENTCAVVFANAGGPPGRNYCGLSQINIPYAGPLVRLGTSAEGMGVATLDLAVLEEAEANYAIRKDLADPSWHYRHTQRIPAEPSKGKL
ncbi:carbon-nitrogen hydrolase [Aspergillus pseudocaelatus]|uniref:Carbon-nitrogen hydrolase n=1 Tax=Aspergillus pseudocaelatus TaxID=1825620 RepID=A0ABQ6W7W2_9EURO|nr:carbon-nitrogen hydrolase [Aspergillus pseudocaelatus]